MTTARSLAAAGIGLLTLWFVNASASAPQKTEKTPEKGAAGNAQAAPPKAEESMRTFMRAKLGASTKVLEGLALEDLDLVREGAIELNRISSAEKWRRHDDMLSPVQRTVPTDNLRSHRCRQGQHVRPGCPEMDECHDELHRMPPLRTEQTRH